MLLNKQIPALEKLGRKGRYKDIFADDALERAVDRAVGKPVRKLTQEDIASLSSITLDVARDQISDPVCPGHNIRAGWGISDLSGIERLTQLRIVGSISQPD